MANFSLEKKATLHFYQQGVTQPSSPLPRQPHNRTFNSASLVNEKRSLKALCCSVPWILEHLTHWQLICTPSVTFCSWYLLTAVKVLVAQSCPTLCDPMGRDPPGSSVHGILQARVPESVAIPFSCGTSWPRNPMSSALQVDSLLPQSPRKPQ